MERSLVAFCLLLSWRSRRLASRAVTPLRLSRRLRRSFFYLPPSLRHARLSPLDCAVRQVAAATRQVDAVRQLPARLLSARSERWRRLLAGGLTDWLAGMSDAARKPAEDVVALYCDFLECAIHSILYERGVYPAGSRHSLPAPLHCHPALRCAEACTARVWCVLFVCCVVVLV